MVRGISLGLKMGLSLGGTTLLFSGLALWILAIAGRQDTDRRAQELLESGQRVLEATIRRETSTLEAECELVAQNEAFRTLAQEGNARRMRQHLEKQVRRLAESHLAWFGSKRELLAEAGEQKAFVTRFCKPIPHGPGTQSAGTGLELFRGGLVLRAELPVYTRDGSKLLGVLALDRRVSRTFLSVLSRANKHGILLQCKNEALALDRPEVTRTKLDAYLEALRGYNEATLVRVGGTSYYTQRLVLRRGDGRPLADAFLDVPASVLTAPYERTQKLVGALTALALALTCGLGLLTARRISRPLLELSRVADAVEKSRWPEPVPITSSDEIGLLQNAFNSMTATLKQSQERLLALVNRDPLTDLYNHRCFKETLGEYIRAAQEVEGGSVGLILIDLDQFAKLNHQHGPSASDKALVEVASRIQSATRDTGKIFRYGGDEFVVLVPGVEIAKVLEIAREICDKIAKSPVYLSLDAAEPISTSLTASVGVGLYPLHTTKSDGLVTAAELALLRAKTLGGGRICSFDSVPGKDEVSDPHELHKFMQDGSLSTILALAAAVDARDPYTHGHSERVTAYALRLGEAVGMPEEELKILRVSGLLHDVGKIGVPDHVLKKPGRLTDEERETMETHPVIGEVICRRAAGLEPYIPGVRWHHERWDGNGYPDGLAQTETPLMARVLAVADTFDAMTSDRPYRRGMPWMVALEEIRQSAGSQLDPELAETFYQIFFAEAQAKDAAREAKIPKAA